MTKHMPGNHSHSIPGQPVGPNTGKSALLPLLVIVVGIGFASAPLALPAIPPMTDLCHHVAVAHILNHYRDPQLRYSDYFELKYSARSTQLFYVLLALLEKGVGPFGAVKLLLVVYVVALWVSATAYLHALGRPNARFIAMAALLLAFFWPVYMGFVPYVLTIPLYACLLAWWLGGRPRMSRSLVAAAVLCTIYGFHIVGAAVGAFSILLLSLWEWQKEAWKPRRILVDICAVAPVGILAGSYLLGSGGPRIVIRYDPLSHIAQSALRYNFASLWDGALWLTLSGFVFYIWLIAVPIFRGVADRRVIALCASLGFVTMLMPISLGALWPAGPRVLPYTLIASLALVSVRKTGTVVYVSTVTVLVVVLSLMTLRTSSVLGRSYARFLSGLEGVAPGSKLLPVLAEPEGGARYISPFWSLASAYVVMRGGATPYMFATPNWPAHASPLQYRRYAEFRYAYIYQPDKGAADYVGVSKWYDFVLLWGSIPGIDAVLSKEMTLVVDNPPLKIYKSRHRERKP